MKSAYRFRHPKGRAIEVQFAHIPGKWKSTGCYTMEGAAEFARKEMLNVSSCEKENITLREFAKGFFTPEDPQGYRKRLARRDSEFEESFFESHQGRLDNYILPAHGDYLLSAINDVMIEDFILDLEDFRHPGVQLANDTKNKILSCYRIVLQEALRKGYVQRNMAKEVVGLNRNWKERGVFEEDEMLKLFPEDDEKLIKVWGGLMWATYFCILKDTGWRPGEVAALQILNYYPELHGIYTTTSVDYKTHLPKDSIKTTKKGQKYKDGFLQDQTARILEQHIAIIGGRTTWLFEYQGEKKREFIYSELANKHLDVCARRVGVDLNDRTQYCFRHTFNTNYIGRLPEVARLLLMGHKQNRKEYLHLTPEQSLKRVLEIEGTAEALGIKKCDT